MLCLGDFEQERMHLLVSQVKMICRLFSEQRLDAAITRSTQSVGERKRRGSADEGQPHPMYQQTIHGNNLTVNPSNAINPSI